MSALLSEEAAKGSLIMLMHKYTFLVESFNNAAATVLEDDTYGLFCISYECNLVHYLHIVKSMFCFYAHIIRGGSQGFNHCVQEQIIPDFFSLVSLSRVSRETL